MTRNLKPMINDRSDRGLASIARATAMAVALCFGAVAPAAAADESSMDAPAATPAPAKGEFDNNSVMDLASGQVVTTDCSVNWTATDDKENPTENIQKA